jgi:hypothetical protein
MRLPATHLQNPSGAGKVSHNPERRLRMIANAGQLAALTRQCRQRERRSAAASSPAGAGIRISWLTSPSFVRQPVEHERLRQTGGQEIDRAEPLKASLLIGSGSMNADVASRSSLDRDTAFQPFIP